MIAAYVHQPRLLVAIDCIIFGFDGTQLKALLIQRGFEPGMGKWSLMGGFVQLEESADEAAQRILFELTGLQNVYMEQLHCFSAVNRDPGARVLSIAYSALIKLDEYSEQITSAYKAKWFPIQKVPSLLFDHKKMLQLAKDHLKQRVLHHPVGFELLPTKFTLPQLQLLYEAILEAPLDKRNFSKKILSLGILKKLDEKEKESSRKGAFFYVFDRKKYQELDRLGLRFL